MAYLPASIIVEGPPAAITTDASAPGPRRERWAARASDGPRACDVGGMAGPEHVRGARHRHMTGQRFAWKRPAEAGWVYRTFSIQAMKKPS